MKRPKGWRVSLYKTTARLLRLLAWQCGIPVGSESGLRVEEAVCTTYHLHVKVNGRWLRIRARADSRKTVAEIMKDVPGR